jgi:hypothetical protein
MDVELQDGTIIEGVPEGTTKAQLMARIGKMNAPKTATQQLLGGFRNSGVFGAGASVLGLDPEKFPILRGLVNAGPVGAAVAGMGEAQKGLGKVGDIAGGATTDVLAPHVPPEVAGIAGAAASIAAPTIVGGLVGKAVGQPVLESGAKQLMQSALKPSSEELVSGKAAKAIQTMLDEGVNVTPAGAAALRSKIGDLHREVSQKIATSPEMVDKAYVASEVTKALTKFRQQVNPGADQAAILKSWSEFNSAWGAKIPIAEAHAMKQGTQQILSKKYGEQGAAAVEAEKAMARGLRLAIEEKIPEVAKLNAKESELLNALYIADKRAGLEGNKNPFSFALLAHNPEAATAFMVDRSSLFKSILARLMHSGSGTIPTAAGAAAGGVAGTAAQRQ